ncbi:hypothetical protein SeMB42_g07467 [Synchytrium endobioticum]|uniref:Uncharacterized protein n=1 Tax=Synchytrium endobioticum TaxID=286115 RepID=A0A507C6E0_9FUNG|nr:hypothetical protein SeMB42_g07467 [Synchytrium endobioticum]TPX40132.1 hypothetical protein SeLEV6574_g06764 [Synchytrium endobioticum]
MLMNDKKRLADQRGGKDDQDDHQYPPQKALRLENPDNPPDNQPHRLSTLQPSRVFSSPWFSGQPSRHEATECRDFRFKSETLIDKLINEVSELKVLQRAMERRYEAILTRMGTLENENNRLKLFVSTIKVDKPPDEEQVPLPVTPAPSRSTSSISVSSPRLPHNSSITPAATTATSSTSVPVHTDPLVTKMPAKNDNNEQETREIKEEVGGALPQDGENARYTPPLKERDGKAKFADLVFKHACENSFYFEYDAHFMRTLEELSLQAFGSHQAYRQQYTDGAIAARATSIRRKHRVLLTQNLRYILNLPDESSNDRVITQCRALLQKGSHIHVGDKYRSAVLGRALGVLFWGGENCCVRWKWTSYPLNAVGFTVYLLEFIMKNAHLPQRPLMNGKELYQCYLQNLRDYQESHPDAFAKTMMGLFLFGRHARDAMNGTHRTSSAQGQGVSRIITSEDAPADMIDVMPP